MIYDPNMAGSVNGCDGAGLSLRKSIITQSLADTRDELEENKANIAYYKRNLDITEYKYFENQAREALVLAELNIIAGEERGVDVTELVAKFKEAVTLFEKIGTDDYDDKLILNITDVMAFETYKVNTLIEELDNEG